MRYLTQRSTPVSASLTVSLGLLPLLTAALTLPGSLPRALAQTPPQPNFPGDRASGMLKAGDRVRVTVVGFPDLSGELPLGADGTLQLPLVGSLPLAGLTPAAATEALDAALRPYVRRPQVSLVVVDSRPLRVSVTGAVGQPGPYRIRPEELGGDPYPTLSGVISLAGGITPDADLRRIVIRRSPLAAASTASGGSLPLGTGAGGELRIDLWEAIQQGRLAADPVILDGDEIVVARAQVISPEQQQQFLRSTVAPAELSISVAGEVRQPGRTVVVPVGGVSAAVAAAGGPTNDANLNEIVLFRMAPNGQLTQQTFRFGEDSGPLHQGDVILVNRNATGNVGSVFNFLGTLLNPFSALSNIFNND
ncbi:polysaccharide biosynthesis/export family protein [Nodosilinea sp. PGN35]|uniref:polysaccharide biosynthesis/export family protein n=1 Tax=Nodosilinea sp. PGN35 TaxID=3020489 RepID=UPI0023B31735|nr:polysaccharide biosynthesis/export family protein [Nodosilinea sp. TSF1-S3]MDF0367032.1 polysaccharide export protein [Nodosilinea sp. TSF1-S3]